MLSFLGRLAVACSFFANFAIAANFVDSRDNRHYKTIPQGNLNWFIEDLAYKNSQAIHKNGSTYYSKETSENVCPEGSHIPTIAEWNELKKERFTGPRKKQNVKSFAGKSRGYIDNKDKNKKIKNKDLAYFIIQGDGPQAIMLDLKRGNSKTVNLQASTLIPIRCVSERDFFAEKNISQKDMIMTDPRDGNKYKIEKKADKFWMISNLKFSLQSAKQCFLEDTLFCKKHGRFYTHNEAKKACPTGWHLPDDGEWRDFQKEKFDWNNLGVGGCKDWDEYCDEANTGHYWSATSIKKNTGRS